MRHALALGEIVITPRAQEALRQVGHDAMLYVCRHARGDWGQALTVAEMADNDAAVVHGGRLLSAYYIQRWQTLWVITEADRSRTIVVLPEEY